MKAVKTAGADTESHQQLGQHPPVYVGEAYVAAAEAVGKLFVVQAELVEDGGVKSGSHSITRTWAGCGSTLRPTRS